MGVKEKICIVFFVAFLIQNNNISQISGADSYCSKTDDGVDCSDDLKTTSMFKEVMKNSIANSGLVYKDKISPFRSVEGTPIFYKFILDQSSDTIDSKQALTACIVDPSSLRKINPGIHTILASSYISDCDIMCPIDTEAVPDSAKLFDFEEYENEFNPESVIFLASTYANQKDISSLTLRRIQLHLSETGQTAEEDFGSLQITGYHESYYLEEKPIFFQFEVVHKNDESPKLLCIIDTGRLQTFTEKKPDQPAAKYIRKCDILCNVIDSEIQGEPVAAVFDLQNGEYDETIVLKIATGCMKKFKIDREGADMLKSRLVLWLATG